MTKVSINNSEQQRVEHQLIVNRLLQQNQPTELVTNAGFGSMLGKVRRKAGDIGRKLSRGFEQGKSGMQKAYGKGSVKVGHAAGKAYSGIKSAGRSIKSKAVSPGGKAALGGAAVGGIAGAGIGVGASQARKKKYQ